MPLNLNVKAKKSKKMEVFGVTQKSFPPASTGSKKVATPLPLLKSKAVNGILKIQPKTPLAGSTATLLKNLTVIPGLA